jgi:microcystin-dependent protein
MSEPFIGQIQTFGFNFPPRGWATCDGQLLSIAQNTALFALLGTTYGGNGTTTFALPDLRGRVALHFGNGPGLTPRVMGERGGSESETLTIQQMPAHNHTLNAHSEEADTNKSENNCLAGSTIYHAPPADVAMAGASIGMAGGSQPHNNMQPFLVVNWCIALQGIFPSRS